MLLSLLACARRYCDSIEVQADVMAPPCRQYDVERRLAMRAQILQQRLVVSEGKFASSTNTNSVQAEADQPNAMKLLRRYFT
jgi:hypothetical protein